MHGADWTLVSIDLSRFTPGFGDNSLVLTYRPPFDMIRASEFPVMTQWLDEGISHE